MFFGGSSARCFTLEFGGPLARLLQVGASLHVQHPAIVNLPGKRHSDSVTSKGASDDAVVVRRWLPTSREEHIAARSMLLRRRWFNSERWHSQPWRSSVWYCPHLRTASLAERFLVCFGIFSLAAHPGFHCGFLAAVGDFKTFEDVLLSITNINTDVGVEAGIPSIDNVLSRVAAVIERRVSSVALRLTNAGHPP